MREGMIFTIEPMINLGRPHVKVLSDGWTAVTRDRSLSAQYEHTVGVTATGCEIFTLSPAGLDRPGLPALVSVSMAKQLRQRLPAQKSAMATGRRATTTSAVSSPNSRCSRRASQTRQAAAEKPHYHGHRDRLRERFASRRPTRLADYELLELLLFRLIPRADTKPIAKALLARFGTLAEVLGAPAALLQEVKGVGAVGGARPEDRRGRRASAWRVSEIKGREILSSWTQVLDYCRAAMAFEEREQFRILFLDKKNALIADEVQQTGTVDHTPVYPREVVRRALELSATRDHPGPQPPFRRPDAVARRHRDDQDDHRHGQAARHRRPRPHHHRQERPCQHEGLR